jgi:hypothetical protein
LDDQGKTECRSIRSSTFANGIVPTLELSKIYTKSVLFKETKGTGILTDNQIFEFRDLSKYIGMSMATLMNKLFDIMNTGQVLNIYLSCIAYGLLTVTDKFIKVLNLIILFTMERLIGRSVDSEYVFIRQIYNHFIPDEIVTNEKLLRAKFKQAGIINN